MPRSIPTRAGTPSDIRILKSSLALVVLMGWLAIPPVCAQSPPQRRYMISIGTPSEKISSGTLWLYSFSYYGVQNIQLAAIENGLALLPLDADRLKRELDPRSEEHTSELQSRLHLV